MRSLISIFVLLTFSSFYSGKCSSESLAPALYVLGDSLIDSGNNNWLNVIIFAKANYNPYGKDFQGGRATGRVTNGRNVPDFIAEYLKLPYPTRVKQPFLPPSLTGYNYASAGCGILPETGPQNCIHLPEQVRLFGLTKEKVLRPEFEDETELDNHIANSIFFIWIGNNDYLLNYFNPATNSSQDYTPEQFADLLTQRLSEKLEELYALGARKIVIFEGAPYGCVPFSVDADGQCIESRNDNAKLFNTKLQEMIQKLSSELSNSYFTLGKAYELTLDAIKNPSNYGLTNVTGSCCELGKLGAQKLVSCKMFGQTCANRSEYVFWDGAHPTEAAYAILGGQCITNSSVCSPYSIQDLVQVNVKSPSLLSAA